MLVSLTFLRISLPELLGKRFSQNLQTSICTWIHSSNFQWSFAGIFLETKKCFQNIAYNLWEKDCKKSCAWQLFWQEIYVWKQRFLFQKVAIFMKRSKGSFIHDFWHQEKLWNHLCYTMLRKAGQKSSHHAYLCRPG